MTERVGAGEEERARMTCDGIRIGCDVVLIERVERLVRRYAPRLLLEAFTAAELAQFDSAQLAQIFAVKEATLKALGTGLRLGISFRDVEVELAHDQPPRVRMHGPLSAVGPAYKLSARTCADGELAHAVALLVRRGGACVTC